MLETTLVQRGGIFSQQGNWQPHVVVDGRLITGQNPASTKGVGKAVLEHKW
jgi:putative intracellular protease/amidase